MNRSSLFIIFFLAACAQPTVWEKPGASQQDFYQESGQCRAQAFSIPGAPMAQIAAVYSNCLAGKGWYQVPK